jgi:hypothetical protein
MAKTRPPPALCRALFTLEKTSRPGRSPDGEVAALKKHYLESDAGPGFFLFLLYTSRQLRYSQIKVIDILPNIFRKVIYGSQVLFPLYCKEVYLGF